MELDLLSFARVAKLYDVHPSTLEKMAAGDPTFPRWAELDGRRYFDRRAILEHYESSQERRKVAAGLA